MLGNTVYGNGVGIQTAYDNERGPVNIENDLVYANTAAGIEVSGDNSGQIINNTVYQIAGDAVQVWTSRNVALLNNILWTQAGYDLGPGR